MAYVNVGGSRVFYRESGRGRPAIFLPAFLTDSRYWLDQLEGLADVRRCIAPDPLGFGQSDPTTARAIEPEVYARQLVGFLDALGIDEPVDLVGFSGGAIVCALFAAAHGSRVASLTLMSSAFTSGPDPAYRRYQQEMARLVVVEGIDALFRRFDEYIFGAQPSLYARARYKTMLADTPYEMFVAFLTSDALGARPELPALLKMPVLLPYGERDVVIHEQQAQALAALMPHAVWRRVPDAGRLLALENPGALNAALREFWSEPRAVASIRR